jgi:hypothetical protein
VVQSHVGPEAQSGGFWNSLSTSCFSGEGIDLVFSSLLVFCQNTGAEFPCLPQSFLSFLRQLPCPSDVTQSCDFKSLCLCRLTDFLLEFSPLPGISVLFILLPPQTNHTPLWFLDSFRAVFSPETCVTQSFI